MSVHDRKREEEWLAQAQRLAADKVEFYIDQYMKQFSFEIGGWWIEHGESQWLRGYMERPRTSDRYSMAHSLFTPRHTSAGYLEEFFEGHDHARLSWFGKGRWGHAAGTLMSTAAGRSAAVGEDIEGQIASEQRMSCVQVGWLPQRRTQSIIDLSPQFMLSVGKRCEFAQMVGSDSHLLPSHAFIGVFHSSNISIA